MPFTIRTVREEELPECGEMYALAFSGPPYSEAWDPRQAAKMLGELLSRDPESCWCIQVDGKPAGFAFCTTFGKTRATIQEFAVSPQFQHKGLGTALMEHVLAVFHNRGIGTVDLVVNKQAPAFDFYRRFGFRQPERYVLMAKRLI